MQENQEVARKVLEGAYAGLTYGQNGHVPRALRLGGAPHLEDIPLKKEKKRKKKKKKEAKKKKKERERV